MSLTSTIEWHPIDTIPHNKRIFVADLLDGVLVTAIAEISPISGEIHIHAPGYPVTGTKWWTHWAAFPEPPPFKVAALGEKE
jgi:hypothetical protein